MRIETSVHDDLTIVTVIGEFVGELVPRFNKAVSDAFSAGRRDFLVDFSQARALDSSALEALTALQGRTQEQLGMLQLCVPDATLRKIFEITRLDQQLTLHASLTEARSAFAGAFVGRPATGDIG
jgi:anti-anti-sigma factor